MPSFLYRAFKEEDHANQFLKGKIRFGLLDYYKNSEDESRRDPFEGESSTFLGQLHLKGGLCNPVYLLCTSGPDVDLDYFRKKFGDFVVKIMNPGQFRDDISNIKAFVPDVNISGNCDFKKVEYTKDQDQPIDVEETVRLRLYYCQKHSYFSPECEYRYVIKLKIGDTSGNFISCNFQRSLDYLMML